MAKIGLAKVQHHVPKPARTAWDYSNFEQVDGQHPWQKAVPEGYVNYRAYRMPGGRSVYFNYDLAKEMGLIPQSHPERMTSGLEEKLLDTFCLRIINEHDELSKRRIPDEVIKKHPYMATRYLQLQHPDKTGRTSGDGRSIWNGSIRHKGKTWDISSRGTGVTRLAPGVIKAGKYLRTGETEFGYGCGTADLDEMIGAAVMSEIFHLQGIPTERTLCVIDLGKGIGIGVRASTNLLRPAHLFNHLKQGNTEALRRAANYMIDREFQNGTWKFSAKTRNCYRLMAGEMARRFAKMAARADIDYIFFWLDWDGDNVLCDGGIIDYGSIRQFGLRHDEYRYDDVDRFSTSLNEQRQKARLIVQTFAQIADYLKTGKKKKLERFKHDPAVRIFDQEFRTAQLEWFLHRVGLAENDRKLLLSKRRDLVEDFFLAFRHLESVKTRRKIEKIADGVNRPAVLNMRRILRELPHLYLLLGTEETPRLSPEEFFDIAVADIVSRRDAAWVRRRLHRQAMDLQNKYLKILHFLTAGKGLKGILKVLEQRTRLINREDRITGNSIEMVTSSIITLLQRGADTNEIQSLIATFVRDQATLPDNHKTVQTGTPRPTSKIHRHYIRLLNHVLEYKEDI